MNLQEIFSRVLHMSLTGSYIILIVLLIRLALRKAPKVFSYALWAVVLFRLLCPVSISSALSVLNFIPSAPSQPQGPVTTLEHPMILDIYSHSPKESIASDTEIVEHISHEPEFTPSFPENRVEIAPVPDAVDQQAAAEPVRNPLRYAVTIWLLGMGALFVYNIYAYLRLSKQTAGAVRLRKNIYLGDHIPTPFVKGLIRPKIYLPSTLAEAERRYIIAHERCHIRRKDPLWKLLGYIAPCIHWFNPLVWLAFVLSAKDMEMSCDEAVIGMYGPKIRAEYAASLLRLATPHRFVALTPLAFGEGDTKGRVMNMAKWKKPGFWAMLCAAIVCIAVLAACATNPSETTQQAENSETPAPNGALQIEAADAMALCTDAMKQLKEAESYFILYEYESDGYSEQQGYIDYRRHGNNLLVKYGEESGIIGDSVYFEGMEGMFMGDYWVQVEPPRQEDANAWLKNWSLEGITIQGMTVEQNTVTFEAVWPYAMDPTGEYRGKVIYIFHNDATLFSIQREYALYLDGGETEPVFDSITVKEEDAQATYAAIKAVADQCITQEELDALRYEKKTVSEIPSNKTNFDLDFALGAGQMRWYFLNEDWQFALGAENPTPTSVTLFHGESDEGHQSLTANEGFWLEKLVDGQWRYVDEGKTQVDAPEVSVNLSWTQTGRYSLDWSDSYGALSPGFYRVGRYYTVTMNSGESDTTVCYAKFRLYDENQEELIKKCRNAVTALLESDSYHIRTYRLVPPHSNFRTFEGETWKYGADYLSRSVNTTVDGEVVINGSLRLNGTGYSISWADGEATSPIISCATVDFFDEEHFRFWQNYFEMYDSKIIGVEQNGDQISVYMEYDFHDNAYTKTEMRFTFEKDGALASVAYIGHCHDGSTLTEDSMEVLDTPAEDIKSLIEGQDVSKPPVFSWAEDKDKYSNAMVSGFVNTASSPITTIEEAIRLADKECTMPPIDALNDDRYNIVEVAYDAGAGIWRIFFRFSQNDEGNQIIYLNNDGITVMIVTT